MVFLEEIKWKQKSKVQWLKEVNNNTKFFHRVAFARGNHNLITRLKFAKIWWGIQRPLKPMWWTFFTNIYADREIYRPSLNGLEFKSLNDSQRDWLERPISEEEVKNIIWNFENDNRQGWMVSLRIFIRIVGKL